MNIPATGDYIDIHTHGAVTAAGIFSVEVLMAHELRIPEINEGISYTAGIHPWFLDADVHDRQLTYVSELAAGGQIVAVGEAGFDKLKGPDADLQKRAFYEQAAISEKYNLPVVIHCVKAWDELLSAHHELNPSMPWMVHGFRGNPQLATQLLKRGFYLSFWFSFITTPQALPLLKSIPADRMFLETDGSGEDIAAIYRTVSSGLGIEEEKLKEGMRDNYLRFFGIGKV